MRRQGLAVLAGALVLTAGCGNVEPGASANGTPTASSDADLAHGTWLLRFTTEDGSEGGVVGTVYVSLDPSTGAAVARAVPGSTDPDTSGSATAVLVSADQKLAVADSRVAPGDSRRGRVTVYSTTSPVQHTVDLAALTGRPGIRPVAAAFDPTTSEVLRVVDDQRRVWKLDLLAGTGTRDGSLPFHRGWMFANRFDKNAGLPYIEDPDSESTLPAGNGFSDVRPVERRGGVIRADDGTDATGPALPCGFSGGFATAAGTVWTFCADTARILTYRLAPGASTWEKVGVASEPIVPASADDLPVVLPPV